MYPVMPYVPAFIPVAHISKPGVFHAAVQVCRTVSYVYASMVVVLRTNLYPRVYVTFSLFMVLALETGAVNPLIV